MRWFSLELGSQKFQKAMKSSLVPFCDRSLRSITETLERWDKKHHFHFLCFSSPIRRRSRNYDLVAKIASFNISSFWGQMAIYFFLFFLSLSELPVLHGHLAYGANDLSSLLANDADIPSEKVTHARFPVLAVDFFFPATRNEGQLSRNMVAW